MSEIVASSGAHTELIAKSKQILAVRRATYDSLASTMLPRLKQQATRRSPTRFPVSPAIASII